MNTTIATGPAATRAAGGRDGVALIICLGLLSIMTLLAVTFAVAMRVERMAARNFADGVRARHLVQASLVRAVQQIDSHMVRKVYPDWDVTGSVGSGGNANLNSPQLDTLLPKGELRTLFNATTPQWVTTSIPGGRVAYVIVNTSGLIDVNTVGGAARVSSTNLQEVSFDADSAPEALGTSATLVAARDAIVRYETLAELPSLSPTIFTPDIQSFQTFSYDPGRDKVFVEQTNSPWWRWIDKRRPPPPGTTGISTLGTRSAELYLHDKFNINSITNYASFWAGGNRNKYLSDASFMTNYWTPLRDMLRDAVLTESGVQSDRPDDVTWNIVNYLDPDRIPHGESGLTPWTKSEGGEPIPMVNEIVVERVFTNTYKVKAELWYPYAPLPVTAADKFIAQVWIWTNLAGVVTTPPALADELTVTNSTFIHPASRTALIDGMVFDSPSEFFVLESGNITLNGPLDTGANRFALLVRVCKIEPDNSLFIVDEGMGYDRADQAANRRRLFLVDNNNKLGSYQINDPRSNGQVRYWTGVNGNFFTNSPGTLGARNDPSILKPNERRGQGLPLYAPDPTGPIRNIAELGHIWRSNLDDEVTDQRDAFWRTIDLMHKTEGAMLLDMMHTGEARKPYTGLFSANSRQESPWRVMLNNLRIGVPNIPTPQLTVSETAKNLLISELRATPRFVSFTDMFTAEQSDAGGGPLADAFRYCAEEQAPLAGDILKEDTFRHVCELMSFRQNIFTIVLAAQVMGANGITPIAERRAVATIYRDAYTGRRFTRNFTWIDN